MRPNQDQEYFSDGITEVLLKTMARIRKRKVSGFASRAGLFRPEYDALRDDPRLQAILAANGLEGRQPRRLAAETTPARLVRLHARD